MTAITPRTMEEAERIHRLKRYLTCGEIIEASEIVEIAMKDIKAIADMEYVSSIMYCLGIKEGIQRERQRRKNTIQ